MANGGNGMHEDFGRWVKSLELGDDSEARQRRWNGVNALQVSDDDNLVETLVRLALKSKQVPTRAQEDGIRNTLRQVDTTFPATGNNRELQVLSAIALAIMMEEGTHDGATAALSIVAATFDGLLKPDVPVDLVGLAKHSIAEMAEQRRERPDMSEWEYPGDVTINIEDDLAKIEQDGENDVGLIVDAFRSLAEKVADGMNAAISHRNKFASSLRPFIQAQDEELEMLWWLTGRRSKEMDCAFESVEPLFQPLLFANELASQTALFPGPLAISSLLSRAGVKGGKKALSDVINATSDEWVHDYLDGYSPSPVTSPIHFALKRRDESGAGNDWIAGWASVVGASPSISMPPLALSVLFYHECLLRRFAD